ncbi:MAG: hypothetical protein B5766_06190 [Candidatus Lumbricidophila eiseniae]|uniref:Uncharacterized protein n=1 Tax=Candidatus Lumbricidiphila eiseniae TaxID=1969409 RepID=A0A2A6FS38_9MICO|nr:MAG: hypothetical protein B5766_06190 [Candidatus Lumbricidophila eiseniae]
MAGAVLRFLAWLAAQMWRLGVGIIGAISQWVRQNWKRVLSWLEKGVSGATIIHWIMQILGLA